MKFFRLLSALAFVVALLFVGGTANATETETDPTFVIPVPSPLLIDNGCAILPDGAGAYPEYVDYTFTVADGLAVYTATVKPEHAVAVQVTTAGRAEASNAVSHTVPVAAGCTESGVIIGDNADPQFVILLTELPYVGADGSLVLPSNPYPEYMAYAVEYVNGTAIVSAYVLPEHAVWVDLTFTDRTSAGDVLTFAPVALPVPAVEVPEPVTHAEPVEQPVAAPVESAVPVVPVEPVAATDAAQTPELTELPYTGAGDVILAGAGVLLIVAGVVMVRRSKARS